VFQDFAPAGARGIALASHLAERRVTERMASTCAAALEQGGIACAIERVKDALAAGAAWCTSFWPACAGRSRGSQELRAESSQLARADAPTEVHSTGAWPPRKGR
jgi:hypothetical protein